MRSMRWLACVAAVAAFSVTGRAQAAGPEGWYLAGSNPASYEIARDSLVTRNGKASGRLSSIKDPSGFGTLMQNIQATNYLGKRVRLSGWIKSKDVESWAGMWMRVDGPNSKSTAFDNMQSRPIKGTMDWARYEIVLDVAQGSEGIFFGILLGQRGTVWLNDLKLETVDNSVPTTGGQGSSTSRSPVNLDFSK
jgi:hypothetical protein